jgi:uncharacterized protein
MSLVAGLGSAAPSRATTIDQAAGQLERGRLVYDFAHVLTRQQALGLNNQLKELQAAQLADPAVILLDRAEGATVQEFALQLGERWKVGSKTQDNGLVFVASIGDRKRWLEVGRDLQPLLPDTVADRLQRDELVPAFRDGRYSDGLASLFRGVRERLEREGGAEAIGRRPAPPAEPAGMAWIVLLLGAAAAGGLALSFPRGYSGQREPTRIPILILGLGALGAAFAAGSASPAAFPGMLLLATPAVVVALVRLSEPFWTPVPLGSVRSLVPRGTALVGGLLGVGLVLFLGHPSPWIWGYLLLSVGVTAAADGYFRRAPRKCPECGGSLRWLPEQEEASFLKPAEDVEQRIGSLDYDVWRCGHCNRSAVMVRGRGPAPHSECPRCHRMTLSQRTVMDPQPAFSGVTTVTDITECRNPDCGYVDQKQRQLPGFGSGWGGGGGGVVFIPPVWGSGGGDSSGGWGGDSGGGGWGDGGFGGGGGGFDGGGAGGDW